MGTYGTSFYGSAYYGDDGVGHLHPEISSGVGSAGDGHLHPQIYGQGITIPGAGFRAVGDGGMPAARRQPQPVSVEVRMWPGRVWIVRQPVGVVAQQQADIVISAAGIELRAVTPRRATGKQRARIRIKAARATFAAAPVIVQTLQGTADAYTFVQTSGVTVGASAPSVVSVQNPLVATAVAWLRVRVCVPVVVAQQQATIEVRAIRWTVAAVGLQTVTATTQAVVSIPAASTRVHAVAPAIVAQQSAVVRVQAGMLRFAAGRPSARGVQHSEVFVQPAGLLVRAPAGLTVAAGGPSTNPWQWLIDEEDDALLGIGDEALVLV